MDNLIIPSFRSVELISPITKLAYLHHIGDVWTKAPDTKYRDILLVGLDGYHQSNKNLYSVWSFMYTLSEDVKDIKEKLRYLCQTIQMSLNFDTTTSILMWAIYHQFAHLTKLYIKGKIKQEDYLNIWKFN